MRPGHVERVHHFLPLGNPRAAVEAHEWPAERKGGGRGGGGGGYDVKIGSTDLDTRLN